METANNNTKVDKGLGQLSMDAARYGCWNIEDLFSQLYHLLLGHTKSRIRAPVLWALTGLTERIKHSSLLLQRLNELATSSELNFKVVLIRSNISTAALNTAIFQKTSLIEGFEAESSPPNYHLMGQPEDQEAKEDVTVDINHETFTVLDIQVLELIQANPWLYPIRRDIGRLRSLCGTDLHLWQALWGWLRCHDVHTSLAKLQREIAELVPLTLEKIFGLILSTALSVVKRREQIVELLELVFFSVRPFSIHEFVDVMEFSSYNQSIKPGFGQSFVRALSSNRIITALLVVRRNEIHFRHSQFRDYLQSSTNNPVLHFSDHPRRVAAHGRLTDLCLKFLLSPQGRKLMEGQGPSEHAPFLESRLNLCSYAVRYWPRHARIAGLDVSSESKPLENLFQTKNILNLWASCYWTHVKRSTREDVAQMAPFSILVEEGLDSPVSEMMNDPQDLVSSEKNWLGTLRVAARVGDREIVHKLLHLQMPSGESWDTVLMACIDSGDQAISQEIMNQISVQPSRLMDPAAVFRRAVLLRQSNLASSIRNLWTAQAKPPFIEPKDILLEACKCGNLTTLEAVLDELSIPEIPNMQEDLIAEVLAGIA